MNYKYALFILLMFYSCQKLNTRSNFEKDIKYYRNGEIKSKGFLFKGEFHGEYKEFYPNGVLKSLTYFKNGIQDSIQKNYYENGKLRQIVKIKNGLPIDEMRVYNEEGVLIAKQSFVIINDSSIINEVINYKLDGTIDSDRSNYYSIKSENDTIKYGEEFIVDIKLKASLYKLNMLVLIGNYDENYNLKDKKNLVTLWDRDDDSIDFEVTYKTKKYELGRNVIRGIIYDYITYYKNDSLGKDTIRDMHPLYFRKDFFVKEK